MYNKSKDPGATLTLLLYLAPFAAGALFGWVIRGAKDTKTPKTS